MRQRLTLTSVHKADANVEDGTTAKAKHDAVVDGLPARGAGGYPSWAIKASSGL